MADREFNIAFNTNLDQVSSSQEKLNNLFAEQLILQQHAVGMSKSQLGYLHNTKETWNRVKLGADLTNDELEKIEKNITDTQEGIEKIQDPFEILLKNITPFGGLLAKQRDKLEALSDSLEKVRDAGGFFEVFSDYLLDFNEKLIAVSGMLTATFGGGVHLMIAKLKVGFAVLLTSIKAMIPVILKIALPIAAIAVAIFALQRMWRTNVGGMQTSFFRFIGAIRSEWAKFVVGFDRLLRLLGPVFKILFTVIFVPLIGVVKILGGLFRMLVAIITPIFDVIGKIGKALLEPFEMLAGPSGKGALDIIDKIAVGMEWIGKIVGFLLKPLHLLVIPFRLLGFYIKLSTTIWGFFIGKIKEAFGLFMELPFVQRMFEAIHLIIDEVKKIFDKMIAPFKFLIEGAKQIAGYLGLGKKETIEQEKATKRMQEIKARPILASPVVNNQRNNVVNNNANVTIHPGAPITRENAPYVGDIIAATLTTGRRVT